VNSAHLTPVSATAAQLLLSAPAQVYPKEHELSGQTIAYQAEGSWGVMWWNDITLEWQGVPSDGSGLIVINQVTEDEAVRLQDWISKAVGTADKLSSETVTDFVTFAKKETKKCVYNASRASFLLTVGVYEWKHQTGIEGYGLYQRRKDDIFKALDVCAAFRFEPAGNQFFPEGAAVIYSLNTCKARCVLRDAFYKTYRQLDGSQIANIPKWKPCSTGRGS